MSADFTITKSGHPAHRTRWLLNHHQIILNLLSYSSHKRRILFIFGDALTALLATAVANLVASTNINITPVTPPHRVVAAGIITALLLIITNLIMRNYSLSWVTFSLADLRKLFIANLLVVIYLSLLKSLPLWQKLAQPHPVVVGMFLFFFVATFRGSRRLLMETSPSRNGGKKTLIVLPADYSYALPNIVRQLNKFYNYHIVGIVTPDIKQVGNYENGIEIIGVTDDIERIVEKYQIAVVIVIFESTATNNIGDFYARLHRIGNLEIKTIPSLIDMLEKRCDLKMLERLAIHELTGRPPVTLDIPRMQEKFGHKSILVTGAGGSIGSELCRQIAQFTPKNIILFERDDTNLFYIERELKSLYPKLHVIPFLGDITHAQDLEEVFARYRPEVVFHAAAYKHVPVLEFHPDEAIRANVFGTHLVAKTAAKYQTRCFVYISTDKAVNPTSVMGATKRLGEMLVTAMNGMNGMTVVVVRFGNVLDSRGSVSTIFREAILKRQPITITHPEMKRYLMLTSEAVVLVLQAAILGKGGEVFVLDMGKPVGILDLARRMIELAGLRPDVDIPIVVTGLRPGEKLFEELLTAEEGTVATNHARIYRARISHNYTYREMLDKLSELETKLNFLSPEELKLALTEFVPTYQPCLSPHNHPVTVKN